MRTHDTDDRRRASRENGRKSRGPVTSEGKARSSRNALKHGLTARVLVAPEDEEAFLERAEAWTEDARPADRMEAWLVERAAWNAVRLDRAARREMAAIAERRRQAADAFDARQKQNLDDAGRLFVLDPHAAVTGLGSSALGCAQMAQLWERLAQAAEQAVAWTEGEELTALRLLGHDPARTPRTGTEPAAVAAWLAEARAGSADARADLAQFARDRADRLTERADRLAHEIEPQARARAIHLSLFDDGAAAVLQRRYETACAGELFRSLAELDRLRRARSSAADPLLPPPPDDLADADQPPAAAPIPDAAPEPAPIATDPVPDRVPEPAPTAPEATAAPAPAVPAEPEPSAAVRPAPDPGPEPALDPALEAALRNEPRLAELLTVREVTAHSPDSPPTPPLVFPSWYVPDRSPLHRGCPLTGPPPRPEG